MYTILHGIHKSPATPTVPAMPHTEPDHGKLCYAAPTTCNVVAPVTPHVLAPVTPNVVAPVTPDVVVFVCHVVAVQTCGCARSCLQALTRVPLLACLFAYRMQ